jgi:hypothetical protein
VGYIHKYNKHFVEINMNIATTTKHVSWNWNIEFIGTGVWFLVIRFMPWITSPVVIACCSVAWQEGVRRI